MEYLQRYCGWIDLPVVPERGFSFAASDVDTVLSPTCAVCAKITQCFSLGVDEEANISLGTVDSLLSGECLHVNFFKNLKFVYGKIPKYEEQELILHHPGESTTTAIQFECSYRDGHRWILTPSAQFELVAGHLVHSPGRALILDPSWIDFEVIRGWISACDRLHGYQCKTFPLFEREDRIQPRFLIDTLQDCIVEGEGVGLEYVALSYTWGQTRNLRNESKICQELRKPGALAQERFHKRLPSTIRDAIAVIQCLGQRYLWVDSLCIVQDDEQQMRVELNQMHRVYAGAVFTIIAADGADANHGLRGFKNLTAPCLLQQQPIPLAAGESIVQDVKSRKLGDPEDSQPEKVYYDRAWTFQENLFSRRKIIFEDNSVHWRCQYSDWYEDLIPDSRVDDRPGDIWALPGKYLAEKWLHTSVPTLSILSDIVGQYNSKVLTFPEDAPSAFAGIQVMLHRIYPGGLTYGMPENFFDIALNWKPGGPLTRRQGSTKSQSGVRSYELPSWSWLGWAGRIGLPNDLEFETALTGIINIEGYTMPVTTWYTMSSPNSVERRYIHPTWHKYKLMSDHAAPDLPGWRCDPYDTASDLHVKRQQRGYQFPRAIPERCYRFASARHETQFQWYPIPVLVRCFQSPIQSQTPFLYAQTSRAFLQIGSVIDEKEDPYRRAPRVRLVKPDSQYVGVLQSNSLSDLEKLLYHPKSTAGKRVELVATCKEYTGQIFDYELAKRTAEATGQKPWSRQLKDCYFVLWIEWEDGVAYRQGCGAVTTEAWESEKETELVELILG
ncbi:MAG: hypothetical protein Q9199_002510 [Rusavskia elegans]